ncbi:hypothetical protein K1719_017947 [Acacia pycnantha]|nr:hypothetical protein K1719_017947 [Acacia pycnantha]
MEGTSPTILRAKWLLFLLLVPELVLKTLPRYSSLKGKTSDAGRNVSTLFLTCMELPMHLYNLHLPQMLTKPRRVLGHMLASVGKGLKKITFKGVEILLSQM